MEEAPAVGDGELIWAASWYFLPAVYPHPDPVGGVAVDLEGETAYVVVAWVSTSGATFRLYPVSLDAVATDATFDPIDPAAGPHPPGVGVTPASEYRLQQFSAGCAAARVTVTSNRGGLDVRLFREHDRCEDVRVRYDFETGVWSPMTSDRAE